jgi:hypothetical protein
MHLDRELRFGVESALATSLPPEDLLFYIDFATSDETPLKVGLSDAASMAMATPAPDPARASSMVLHHSPLPLVSAATARSKTLSKILQSGSQFGMVVRTPSGLLTIIGRTVNPLQLLQRTTAECLLEADRQREALSVF